ncbi:MAG: extracellular solute-binding protein, partial [Clostridia bacterium]|nr:extracellular solute-binding protein [Clostridia bacterium]
EIKSFADLWNPELEDSIAIPDMTATTGPMFYFATAETFGLVPGVDDEAIFAKLAELKPNVVNTYTSANNTITMLNQGEISVAVLLDYSYTTAKNANPDYIWVDPVEGSFASYNMINLVAGSDVKDLATEFINYYISYDVQLAEALDGVDSPVRTDIELTAEQSGNFTYGEEMVAGLKFVDWNTITENQAKWIEMWNSTFSVK